MQQVVLRGFTEPRSVQLLLHLLLFVIAVFITAGVLVKADGCLHRIVAQQHFCVLVQIIEASRFRPEQPLKREQKPIRHTQDDTACMRINGHLLIGTLLTSRGERTEGFSGALQQKSFHEAKGPESQNQAILLSSRSIKRDARLSLKTFKTSAHLNSPSVRQWCPLFRSTASTKGRTAERH